MVELLVRLSSVHPSSVTDVLWLSIRSEKKLSTRINSHVPLTRACKISAILVQADRTVLNFGLNGWKYVHFNGKLAISQKQ